MATATILAVGHVANGVVHFRIAPPVVVVTDADVDALVDEVFAKPGLGIQDSAGIVDAAAYFGFDDDAPSLGLVFGPADRYDGAIEDDADWIRQGC